MTTIKRGKWRHASTWRDQVRTFVREVSPHKMDHVPVYPFLDSELPEAFQCEVGTEAYTNGVLDLALREHIDPWKGRGFGVVVAAEARSCPERLMSSVSHELAHFADLTVIAGRNGFLDLLANDPVRMSPAVRGCASKGIEAIHASVSRDRTETVPWAHHGLIFIWLCCHLEYRVWEWADIVQPHLGFAGPFYGLSPTDIYLRAAGTAPRDMMNSSLLEIAATPPPDAITELFARDCEVWHAAHPERH